MSLTLAGRLFHDVGAAVWMIYLPEFSLFFPLSTALVVLEMIEAGIYIAPLIELDCRYRTAPVDILL